VFFVDFGLYTVISILGLWFHEVNMYCPAHTARMSPRRWLQRIRPGGSPRLTSFIDPLGARYGSVRATVPGRG
jgi:hypothetical protein